MYNAHRRAILSGSLSPSSSLVRAHQTGITLQQNEGVTTEGGEKSSKKKNDGEDDERVMIVVRWAVALDHKIRFLKTRLDFIPLSLSRFLFLVPAKSSPDDENTAGKTMSSSLPRQQLWKSRPRI